MTVLHLELYRICRRMRQKKGLPLAILLAAAAILLFPGAAARGALALGAVLCWKKLS